MKQYNVAVVGIGMVGKKMVEILLERNFPAASLRVLATRAREETISGRTFAVEETKESSFDGIDVAFFAGTEGEKGAGKAFARRAAEKGAIVIDNGADFRMEDDVPLVVPEVNPQALDGHHGLIANPNCSTIQMVMAICPLNRAFRVTGIIASSYQAVSGTGRKAVEELERQVRQYAAGEKPTFDTYPRQIAFNVLPHIGSLSSDFPGYYTEEVKMIKETRKILGAPDMRVSATCVRVPVFNAHSETVTVLCERTPDVSAAKKALAGFPGVTMIEDDGDYPVPLDVSGRDDVFVGRLRRNACFDNALDMWVVSDNIRKGAALNAVQIAEEMIRRKLL